MVVDGLGEEWVFLVNGGGFFWMDRAGRCADGNQGRYPRGEVYVGAHRGVAFLGQQKSVVRNWCGCYFSVDRRIVVYFFAGRSVFIWSTQNGVVYE